MAYSDAAYNRLLARVSKLEEVVNDILTAQSRFITLTQINQLLVIQQTDQDVLREQVSSLNDRIVAIEEETIS